MNNIKIIQEELIKINRCLKNLKQDLGGEIEGSCDYISLASESCYKIKDIVSQLSDFSHEELIEQKVRERELLLAKNKAEEINKLKTIFLANMSHEVRTPLIAILGYAEMILDEDYDSELKEKIGIIFKSGKKLNETLDTILDISKIEAEKLDINLEKFNLGEVINESVTLYKIFADEKGVEIKYLPGTNGLMVEFDKGMFSKIINYLLSNAVKYTSEGEVVISTSLEEKKIKIEIEDTGIGIPEDKLNLIFEPFRQVSEGYNRRFDGTGLGLTITKMLVEKLNGNITLDSQDGKGSKFTVEFPLQVEGWGYTFSDVKEGTGTNGNEQ